MQCRALLQSLLAFALALALSMVLPRRSRWSIRGAFAGAMVIRQALCTLVSSGGVPCARTALVFFHTFARLKQLAQLNASAIVGI